MTLVRVKAAMAETQLQLKWNSMMGVRPLDAQVRTPPVSD